MYTPVKRQNALWTMTFLHFRSTAFLHDCMCAQHRLRSAFAQADQRLLCSSEYTLDAWLTTDCPAKSLSVGRTSNSAGTAVSRLKTSRKHTYKTLTPLKPHFYTVKLGFTGVYIIFLISAQKHRLWVLVRTASPRRF